VSITPMAHSSMNEREVISVWSPDGESSWIVGAESEHTVKRIRLYSEAGEMGMVPYLCIEHHDGRETRTAARHYDVTFPAEEVTP